MDGLELQNRGDAESPSEGNTSHRSGFKVDAKNVTLTNNKLTNGLGELAGLSNAIQIRTPEANNLSAYVIENNEFIGHESSWGLDWTSTGVFITEGYGSYKEITAALDGYKNILAKNEFTRNSIDLTHTDYKKTNGTLYKYRLPLGRVTSINNAITQAEALTESDYTAETWSTLQTALSAAKTVAENIDAKTTEQDGTYTADIILAKDALEAAIDGLVDPSKTTATTAAELEAALANTDVTDITVTGTLGSDVRETGYTIYNVDRAVTIQGAAEAKVYGSFIVKADNVTIDNLAIQNKGDLNGESSGNRGGIYVFAKNITLTKNTITNGLGTEAGLSNAIQIMSSTENNPLSSYVITGNELIGHNNEVTDWSSSGIVITQGSHSGTVGGTGQTITVAENDYQNILTNNTFTNNKIDLQHKSAGQVIYPHAITGLTITGDAKVGEILTANIVPTQATASYQWLVWESDAWTNIAGAIESTYTIAEGYAGKYIAVRADGTDDYATWWWQSDNVQVVKADGPEAPLVKNFNPHGDPGIIMLKKDGTSFRIKAGTNMIGYEYSIDDGSSWVDLVVDTEITVEGETILIRAKETDTHKPGEEAKVILTTEGYVFNSNTGTILSYAGTATVLTIPDTIDGVNVIAIDDRSFGGVNVTDGKRLTSVTLPTHLETIGAFAFMNNELTSIVIPTSVTFVNTQAFEKNKLIEVTIPDSVNQIGIQAFLYNGPNQNSDNITTTSPDFVGTWKVELEGENYVWKKQS